MRGGRDAVGSCDLLVGPGSLQHLDLVAIRILHEEELGDHFPAWGEGDDVLGLVAQGLDAFMLGIEVIHAQRDVAVAVAVGIGLRLTLVQGQLDLKIVLVVAQVHQGEIVKIQIAFFLDVERLLVKGLGALHIQNTDHRMNHFSHCRSLTSL